MEIQTILRNIDFYFGNKKILYNQILTKEESSILPTISYPKSKDKLYTIIMIDPDAPIRTNPTKRYMLHWLVLNNDKTVAVYKGPNPPLGSGAHRYYTCVFEQKVPISDEKYNYLNNSRANFNIIKFSADNNLKIIGIFKFQVVG